MRIGLVTFAAAGRFRVVATPIREFIHKLKWGDAAELLIVKSGGAIDVGYLEDGRPGVRCPHGIVTEMKE